MRHNPTNIYYCKVLDVTDDNAGLRIKVNIPTVDPDGAKLEDLPYVFPLLPKFLNINPKVGECVFVILQDIGAPSGPRFFLGPVISQDYYMHFEPFDFSRKLIQGQDISVGKPLENPKNNPENRGSLVDREDIALRGRDNCDLILKPNELILRCGFKYEQNGYITDQLRFNKINPAYIQMKFENKVFDGEQSNGNNKLSTINIVADKINLMSHRTSSVNLANPEGMISNNDQNYIYGKAHQMVYGDVLAGILNDIMTLLNEHTHPFATNTPDFTDEQKAKLNVERLQHLLSNDIRLY